MYQIRFGFFVFFGLADSLKELSTLAFLWFQRMFIQISNSGTEKSFADIVTANKTSPLFNLCFGNKFT